MADESPADLLERAQLLQKAKQIQAQKMQSASQSQPVAEQTTATEAGLQGFGQGGTLGYLPQLQARTAQGVQLMTGDEDPQSYEDLKKYFQTKNETMKNEHPIASTAGNVAGAIATLPVGGAEAKGASLLSKMGRAAAVGGAYGGLANPEVESTEQDPHAELRARLQNAGIGIAAGGGGEALIGNLGPKLAKAGEKFSQKAVVKQIGANAGQIKKILQKEEIPKIEGYLVNEGLMGAGTSLDDVVEKSKGVVDDLGPKIGKLYQDAQDAALVANVGMPEKVHRIDGNKLADEIIATVKLNSKNHPDRNLVTKTMEEAVAPLRDMGENANITDLHQFRKGLDENINWGAKSQERDAVQRAYMDARNMVADETKKSINSLDEALGNNQLQDLKKMNEVYSAASTVNNISTQGQARETAKAFMGHGLIGVGAGGTAATLEYKRSHDPLKAMGVGLATTLGVTAARKFGTPVGYYGGKGVQMMGRGLEAVTPNAEKMGAGMTSPWINMQEQK